MERKFIAEYQAKGYELLNVESGGSTGKTDINQRKLGKGYRDGIHQGYKNAKKDVWQLFEKNLTYSINGKPNKNKEKALLKFEKFLNIQD